MPVTAQGLQWGLAMGTYQQGYLGTAVQGCANRSHGVPVGCPILQPLVGIPSPRFARPWGAGLKSLAPVPPVPVLPDTPFNHYTQSVHTPEQEHSAACELKLLFPLRLG